MENYARTGRYINQAERFFIEAELANKETVSAIARKLKRGRVTIQREIRRGTVVLMGPLGYEAVYRADYAQMRADERQKAKGTGLKIGNDLHTAIVLRDMIVERKWSPKAALGYAKAHNLLTTEFSLPTLYSYIYSGVLLDVEEKHLPRGRAAKKKERKKYRNSHRTPKGTSIELRPKSVLNRKEFGHWEGDLIVGKQGTKTVVLTLVERKTRFCITARLESKHAWRVVREIDKLEKLFGKRFYETFKSITFDNGLEFASYVEMEASRWKTRKEKRTRIYYALPYCSSERGSNENCNGMLRRAGYTKGSNLGLMTQSQMEEATAWVNDYPRRPLGFKSAREAFDEGLAKL